jgi:hypothetical protein
MSGVVGFGLSLAAFAALALSQAKHKRHALQGVSTVISSKAWLFQPLGWVLLAAATLWCVTAYQFGYGLAVLAAAATLAGWLVAMLLAYKPIAVSGSFFAGIGLAALAFLATGIG